MASSKRNAQFFESLEGQEIEQMLISMVKDEVFNTESSYSANENLYPDHVMSFVEKHKSYLLKHPSTDPMQYLANLRLITRRRVSA